jgi:hypothetical protein
MILFPQVEIGCWAYLFLSNVRDLRLELELIDNGGIIFNENVVSLASSTFQIFLEFPIVFVGKILHLALEQLHLSVMIAAEIRLVSHLFN